MLALNVPSAVALGSPGLDRTIEPTAMCPPAPYLHPVLPVREIGLAADSAINKILATHVALEKLSKQDLQALLQRSNVRTARRQEVIYRRGDPVSSVLVVLDGYVKLSRFLANGSEVFLDIAGPRGSVGDVAAIKKCPHNANVAALSPCRLLLIDAREFRRVVEHQPEGFLAMLRLENVRVERLTEQLVDNITLSAPERLARALLRLARLTRSGESDRAALPLRLSQGELGVMSGICRELVCKYLGAWRHAGLIQMFGGTVVAIRTAELAKMSGDDMDADRRCVAV
jgi:CRP-like cAMP-binding protein